MVGVMLLTAGAGFMMVTDAPADCPELAAVTVTVLGEGGIPGAV